MVFVKYNDVWLRIIAAILVAHFIVMYGVQKSLFQVLLTGIYYVAMLGSIIIALILMWFVRMVAISLDKRFDWRKRPVERIGLQILLGFLAPAVLAFLLAFIYFSFRSMNILDTLYLRFDYPIILLLILFLNLYYLAYYFYGQMNIAESAVFNSPIMETTETGKENTKSFMVNQGAKSIPIAIKEIAYFFREGEFNFLRSFSGDDYNITYSLDEVEQHLSDLDFFRANRQLLVNRKACKHFEVLPYSKLELFVEPKYKHSIVISQKRNKGFKQWVK